MRGEKLSDAIVYDKLNLLKKDFVGYIGHNSEKVDANLPVFYGHVVSALENSFPDILDESYDEFIDLITFEVLNASRNSSDFGYISRVIQNALRYKKRKDAETGINIVVGLKLIKTGDYAHAIDFLEKYRTLGGRRLPGHRRVKHHRRGVAPPPAGCPDGSSPTEPSSLPRLIRDCWPLKGTRAPLLLC